MLFAVFRSAGTGWGPGGLEDQKCWSEHAAFMNALVDRGVVRLGGPIGDREVLLVAEGADAKQVCEALSEDPWSKLDILPVYRITPWTVRLGAL